MPLELTQDARALWPQMRRDGGWWTARALARHWHPTFPQWEVEQLLQALARGGHLAARDDLLPQETSYCFTSECTALLGAEENTHHA